jgi:formylmethanofuran dehydrogenase subunit C
MNMKKFWFIVLACWSSHAVAQQTETRATGSFTGVKTQEAIDVYLKKGDKESARVEVTGASVSDVITEISGSYLKIHMRNGNYRGKVQAKVYVTYVQVNKLSASSAGSIFSEGPIKASSMEISASSAGTVEVNVEAGDITTSASTAGDIELEGKSRSLSADAATAGEIDAYDLESENVTAEASTGGSVKVYVKNSFVARASSGGDIRYRGNPDKSVTNSSSGGSVKKSN